MVSYETLRKYDSVFQLDVRLLPDSSLDRLGAQRKIRRVDALENLAERWSRPFGIEAVEA